MPRKAPHVAALDPRPEAQGRISAQQFPPQRLISSAIRQRAVLLTAKCQAAGKLVASDLANAKANLRNAARLRLDLGDAVA